MRTNITTAAAALIMASGLILAACGSARVVGRTAIGGELALEGERNQAMKDARRKMETHCRGPYTVIAEGETLVGTTMEMTSGAADEDVGLAQAATVVGQSTEWHVRYLCGNAPLDPAPAPCPEPVDCSAAQPDPGAAQPIPAPAEQLPPLPPTYR